MKKLVLVICFFLSFLTVCIAQSKKQTSGYSPIGKPGSVAYYNDDKVRYSASSYRIVKNPLYEVTVTGDPQVPGGLTIPPQADEEDVVNDRVRQVEIMSGSNTLYIGELPTELITADGKKVPIKIRRKKASKKLLAVINCGNWARELSDGERVTTNTVYKDCIPGPEKLIDEQTLTDGTLVKVYSDGCTKTIKTFKQVVKTETQYINNSKPCDCDPKALVDVAKMGKTIGKLNSSPTFEIKNVIPQDLRDAIFAQAPELAKMKKAKFLHIQRGICDDTKNTFTVEALDTEGRTKTFLIGLAVGAGIGYGIGKIGGGNENPTKSTNGPPTRPGAQPF